jgi:hypothetical protein
MPTSHELEKLRPGARLAICNSADDAAFTPVTNCGAEELSNLGNPDTGVHGLVRNGLKNVGRTFL